jgi:hypothetical protein
MTLRFSLPSFIWLSCHKKNLRTCSSLNVDDPTIATGLTWLGLFPCARRDGQTWTHVALLDRKPLAVSGSACVGGRQLVLFVYMHEVN